MQFSETELAPTAGVLAWSVVGYPHCLLLCHSGCSPHCYVAYFVCDYSKLDFVAFLFFLIL